MTASAGSGARTAALGEAAADALGSVEAALVDDAAGALAAGAELGDGVEDEHALTTSAKSAVRAMYRCLLLLGLTPFDVTDE